MTITTTQQPVDRAQTRFGRGGFKMRNDRPISSRLEAMPDPWKDHVGRWFTNGHIHGVMIQASGTFAVVLAVNPDYEVVNAGQFSVATFSASDHVAEYNPTIDELTVYRRLVTDVLLPATWAGEGRG